MEFRADMQRYFGVCVDDLGNGLTVGHLAALARCLPLGSSTLARINPKYAYTETDWLLLGILNSLREEPFDPFENRESEKVSMTAEQMAYMLSLPRKKVEDGN